VERGGGGESIFKGFNMIQLSSIKNENLVTFVEIREICGFFSQEAYG
jgi:hypothetical protein